MNIKILGTGCPNCQKLEANTKQALEELKLEAKIEKIIEIQDIMSYGVMGTPALVVDEKVEVSGRIPDISEIKTILSK
jgi:small redox-active disulfide protein 2